MREFLIRFARHEEIYDSEYFSSVEKSSSSGASIMAQSLNRIYQPTRVVDVGCGTGSLLAAFEKLGAEVQGFDYSEAALSFCRGKGLSVQALDLESERTPLPPKADLAVSFEVAEHLSPRFADHYRQFLTGIAPNLAFSAATPGQGGDNHVNEQPHEYWIKKIEAHGMSFLEKPTREARSEWTASGVPNEYAANVLLFVRTSAAKADSK